MTLHKSFNIDRWLDAQPLDWPEALIQLIDALREFIRSDIDIAADLLREGCISRDEYNTGMIETKQMMMLLRKLEDHGIDPTLHGIIKLGDLR